MTVEGYCGLFGSGKTAAMVMEAYHARRRNPELPVMTNLGRLDLPGVPVSYLSVEDGLDAVVEALRAFHDGFLLLDEVGVFLPARLWNRLPVELSWKWAQLRKDAIQLRWTCIRPNNAVKDLRDITFCTHWCESYRRFGFFALKTFSYTAIGQKAYFEGRRFVRFRSSLFGKLYDTMGKVGAPEWAGGTRVKQPYKVGEAASLAGGAQLEVPAGSGEGVSLDVT
jgi:hypothetical protein